MCSKCAVLRARNDVICKYGRIPNTILLIPHSLFIVDYLGRVAPLNGECIPIISRTVWRTNADNTNDLCLAYASVKNYTSVAE